MPCRNSKPLNEQARMTEDRLAGARGREGALRMTLRQREAEADVMWAVVEATRREHLSRDGKRLHPLCAACDAHLALRRFEETPYELREPLADQGAKKDEPLLTSAERFRLRDHLARQKESGADQGASD
jgi:hypothetical protein